MPKLFKRSEDFQKGLTLIELLVVMVIIAILAVVTAFNFIGLTSKARDTRRKTDLDFFYKVLTTYHLDHGFFPTFQTAGISSLNCTITPFPTPECESLLSELRVYTQKIPFDPSDNSTPDHNDCSGASCYKYITPDPAHSVSCICAQLENTNEVRRPPSCNGAEQNYCIQVLF